MIINKNEGIKYSIIMYVIMFWMNIFHSMQF